VEKENMSGFGVISGLSYYNRGYCKPGEDSGLYSGYNPYNPVQHRVIF